MNKIATNLDIDYNASNGDGGAAFDFNCPDCGDSIRVFECGWNDTECSCGLKWQLDTITATGKK